MADISISRGKNYLSWTQEVFLTVLDLAPLLIQNDDHTPLVGEAESLL